MLRAPIDAMHSELDYYAAQLAGAPTERPLPDMAARAADQRAGALINEISILEHKLESALLADDGTIDSEEDIASLRAQLAYLQAD